MTFSNESASGWQQAAFLTPVTVTANTVYVASYHTNTGFYATTNSGLATGVDNGPLHALANGVSGTNGVFAYGASSVFPTQSFQASNYWVDVIFAGVQPPDTTAPTVAVTTPASGATFRVMRSASGNRIGQRWCGRRSVHVDGVNLSEVTTAPYAMTWNASAVVNGSHTLGARAAMRQCGHRHSGR